MFTSVLSAGGPAVKELEHHFQRTMEERDRLSFRRLLHRQTTTEQWLTANLTTNQLHETESPSKLMVMSRVRSSSD